jgi:hypothetical protein
MNRTPQQLLWRFFWQALAQELVQCVCMLGMEVMPRFYVKLKEIGSI